MHMKKHILSFIFFSTTLIGLAASASVNLPHGATVAVPGATASAEIDLAGGVVVDNLIPFKIVTSGGAVLYQGNLQNRVVRSTSTGQLHFYYRIRDTAAGLSGKVLGVSTQNFRVPPRIATSYRVDGLGTVAPVSATRSANGAQVIFRFPAQGQGMLIAGQSSKFFELKTTAKNYNKDGLTRITLTTGESVVLKTVQPAVP
jgi:hypothetical protein